VSDESHAAILRQFGWQLICANQDARNMMLCLEDLSEDELKKVKATFESLAAAPAAAGRIRDTTEQLKDAGNALHGAVAKLRHTTQEPHPQA
jgi:hypothetical protein